MISICKIPGSLWKEIIQKSRNFLNKQTARANRRKVIFLGSLFLYSYLKKKGRPSGKEDLLWICMIIDLLIIVIIDISIYPTEKLLFRVVGDKKVKSWSRMYVTWRLGRYDNSWNKSSTWSYMLFHMHRVGVSMVHILPVTEINIYSSLYHDMYELWADFCPCLPTVLWNYNELFVLRMWSPRERSMQDILSSVIPGTP